MYLGFNIKNLFAALADKKNVNSYKSKKFSQKENKRRLNCGEAMDNPLVPMNLTV
jgi:hypothetical protein